MHNLSPGRPASHGTRGSGREPFPVHSGGWHVFPAKQAHPRPSAWSVQTVWGPWRRTLEQSPCHPVLPPPPGTFSCLCPGSDLAFGVLPPAGTRRGSSQATWLLSLRWASSPTSLLRDSLVFQKKGETTIKDRRKERIADGSFPEFKKQCTWLGHRELTEPGRGCGTSQEVAIPLLLQRVPSRRKSSSVDPVWCLIDREAGSTGNTPLILTLGSMR